MTRALLLAALAGGCATPSSFQSARLLAPGRHEVGAAMAYARVDQDAFPDWSAYEVDGWIRRGVTPSLEAGLRATGGFSSGGSWDDTEELLLSGDAKYAVMADELAAQLTIGVGRRNDDWHDLQLQPAAIWTSVLSPALELDATAKVLLVSDDEDLGKLGRVSVAALVGARWDLGFVALHPEIGLMIVDVAGDFEQTFGVSVVVGGGIGVVLTP